CSLASGKALVISGIVAGAAWAAATGSEVSTLMTHTPPTSESVRAETAVSDAGAFCAAVAHASLARGATLASTLIESPNSAPGSELPLASTERTVESASCPCVCIQSAAASPTTAASNLPTVIEGGEGVARLTVKLDPSTEPETRRPSPKLA